MRQFAAVAQASLEKDYYTILDIPSHATQEDIKEAYRALAKKHHPDAAGPTSTPEELEASKELFKQVTEAYAILSDQALRTKYDRIIFGDSADKPEFENEGEYQ